MNWPNWAFERFQAAARPLRSEQRQLRVFPEGLLRLLETYFYLTLAWEIPTLASNISVSTDIVKS
jgi:hypothetical protein